MKLRVQKKHRLLKMKRIKLIISLTVCMILSLALIGCGEKMTVEEIKNALPALIEESEVLNGIYFGNGFKIDAEKSDVTRDGGYFVCDGSEYGMNSVSDIKSATEKVFTNEYAKVLYESAFSSEDGSPRFKDGDGVLLQKAGDTGYVISDREYEYSSIKVQSRKGNRTTVLINTTVNGVISDKLTLVIVRSGSMGNYSYRLDGPTY